MRKLMWVTLGFALACALAVWILTETYFVPLMAAGLLCGVGCLFWKPVRAVGLVFLGLALGLGWYSVYDDFYLQLPRDLDGREQELTVVCADYSYETLYGSAVDGLVELEGKRYQIRIYLDDPMELVPGDAVMGIFRLRLTSPGGREEATYHAGKGIFLLGYQEGAVEIRGVTNAPFWCKPAVWRQQIREMLQDAFPEDVYPFVKALLLGDTYDLSYEIDTAFKLSGIRHIVAVSGLHISILYGLLCTLTANKRFLTALLGIPALCAFAAVAGFTPSVLRACIMVGLMMGAVLFQREYDPPTALAFAALVMLAGNPLAITSVSFQLSVGCVAGILLFSSSIQDWLSERIPGKGRLRRWFCSGVAVTLSAMSLTMPLSAYYFGSVSLVSIVTNLLTLWAVTLIFGGILVVCGLSLIWAGGASLLAWLLTWPIRCVLTTARLLGGLPFAAVYARNPWIVLWLVLCYVLLAVLLLSKKKRPLLLSGIAAVGLCAAVLVPILELRGDSCRITVLDVGQGQSILLQSEGRTYLTDCGGDSDTDTADLLAETLLTQGITRLDGVILTHYDRDHAGALENLLTRIDTDMLILPVPAQPIGEGENREFVSDSLEIAYGSTKLTVYGVPVTEAAEENNLCVLFETENCAILITGDLNAPAERRLLREKELPDVDVLIAGHHGSKYATCEELLQAVKPEQVVISVGAGNPYGHPTKETLERLADYGCTVFRTDQSGTIMFRR